MTDIPIIFSAPMVLALLAGRKTMTRRLAWRLGRPSKAAMADASAKGFAGVMRPTVSSPWQKVNPGDRLWVRERLCSFGHFGFPLGPMSQTDSLGKPVWGYFVGGPPAEITGGRPSIHCPRWASRLTLVVTATKVEPLKSMSKADAIAEGVQQIDAKTWGVPGSGCESFNGGPVVAFQALWESLHGIGSWEANPEVVALTFKIIKANIDAPEARAA